MGIVKKSSNTFVSHFDTCLYLKIIGVQSELHLGHSFPVMYLTVEGLNAIGKLSPEEYEFYKNRYTESLDDFKPSLLDRALESNIVVKTRAAERKALNRHFAGVLEQWSKLKPESRAYHIKEASKHPTLKNAKLVVDLGETPEC
ncbi:hypothetical protein ACFLRN_02855 [Thermoproteota archaeon]